MLSRTDVRLAHAKQQRFTVHNPDQHDAKELLQRLSDGYVISPKSGGMFRPLKGSDREVKAFRALEQANAIFKELFAKQLFICYGTLLGCIRENDFIENDDDIDVCFMADGDSLDSAANEFAQVVASLQARGERITVVSQIQFHWWLAGMEIDVFMAWMEDDRLYCYNVGADFSIDRILPLENHKFKGEEVLVPRDSEGVLEAIYGPEWRVPDPHFQWRPNLDVRQKMREVNGTSPNRRIVRERIRYHWTAFYGTTRTTIPSPFAASVAVELPDTCAIVDLGCGNGRDSFFFSQLGHSVLGLDLANEVIEGNRARARTEELGPRFERTDISQPIDLSSVLSTFLNEAQADSSTWSLPVAIYARFLLHAITEDQERTLLETLSRHVTSGTPCYFEFRTEKDANTHKQFGEHYRRYINAERFVESATAGGSFECDYKMEGRGMAKFRNEDPYVARVHLRRT